MSSSFTDSSDDDSDAGDRADAVFNSITELETARGFEYLGKLGEGTYGDVLKVYDKRSRQCKAAKVIIKKNACETEMRIWSSLKHKNIIATEGKTILSDGTVIILMPLQFKSLLDVIQDKKFIKNEKSFSYVRRWMYEALEGVDYMHRNRLCHLDLKLDNILISHDGLAMICDFSFANNSTYPLENDDIGLPRVYRPPELFQKSSHNAKFGMSIDCWSFGILVVEAMTREGLMNRIRKCANWKRDVRPVLKIILEQNVFEALIKDSFPNYSFKDNEIEDTLDFIDGFLRIKPEERILTSHALRHRFIQNSMDITVDLKEIYPELLLNEKYNPEIHAKTSMENVREKRNSKKKKGVGSQTPACTEWKPKELLESQKFVKMSKMRNSGFAFHLGSTLLNFRSFATANAQANFGKSKRLKKLILFWRKLRRRFKFSSTLRKEVLVSAKTPHHTTKENAYFEKDSDTKLVPDAQWKTDMLKEDELLCTMNEKSLVKSKQLQSQKPLQKAKANFTRLTKSAEGYKCFLATRGQASEQRGFKYASLTDLGIHLPDSLKSHNASQEDNPQEYDHSSKSGKSAYSMSHEINYSGNNEQMSPPKSHSGHDSTESFKDCLPCPKASDKSGCIQQSLGMTCVLLEDIPAPPGKLMPMDNKMGQQKAESTDCMTSETTVEETKHVE